MSAFIVLCRDNCIEVVSDGATYTPDGRLMLVKRKAIALPEIPAAIFGRGPAMPCARCSLLRRRTRHTPALKRR